MLAKISRTSPGNDNIPYWVYRDCSNELADIVSRLFNMSVRRGVIPAAWRTAVITPVPKCIPVSGVSDLRPISVTPILSRMVERLVVRNHISLAIPPAKLNDKFGFKPINRYIVQGSGIEPTLFTICIIDLQTLGATHHICKHADDSSLLVPEKFDIDIVRS